jgi:hypothetical protein
MFRPGITSAHFLSNFDSKNSTGAQSPDPEAQKNDSKILPTFSGAIPKVEVDIIKLIAKWYRAANFTPGKGYILLSKFLKH